MAELRDPGRGAGRLIGAGLTPEEAVAQRAQGVTAQDAAVMRRLRQLGSG